MRGPNIFKFFHDGITDNHSTDWKINLLMEDLNIN